MEVIHTDKNKISPYHLDIYVPSCKIAFEYDGLYWHSIEGLKARNIKSVKLELYHLFKTESCENKNIRLIHIFEDEWLFKQKIVKEKIKYILGKSYNLPKVYARKCFIKEISSSRKNKFLNKYHLQGEDKSNINLGLYWKNPKTNKNKLVSVMTFCKPRRALGQKNSKYDYELSRFVNNSDYIVLGSFGKLFNYFKEKYEWNSLITYADRRWSQGDVYIKNGWFHHHNSKPNYWYTDGKERFHRFRFNKQHLKEYSQNPNSKYYEIFKNIYDDNKTEKQIMKESKFYTIYDCGNMVFIYNRKDNDEKKNYR